MLHQDRQVRCGNAACLGKETALSRLDLSTSTVSKDWVLRLWLPVEADQSCSVFEGNWHRSGRRDATPVSPACTRVRIALPTVTCRNEQRLSVCPSLYTSLFTAVWDENQAFSKRVHTIETQIKGLKKAADSALRPAPPVYSLDSAPSVDSPHNRTEFIVTCPKFQAL